MEEKNKLVCIENTKFIYMTNFSGDPERDRFGSTTRRANVIIPDPEQARELFDMGFNVKQTKPRDDEDESTFEPTYFVAVNLNYDSYYPPRVYLVSGEAEPVLLDEETISQLDSCQVKNVNVTLNPYHNQRTNTRSLYVRTMYVEQDVETDPFASRYFRR